MDFRGHRPRLLQRGQRHRRACSLSPIIRSPFFRAASRTPRLSARIANASGSNSLQAPARRCRSLQSPDESFPALPYGTIVELEGKARTPHNYANPGEFDYVDYLARQWIYWNLSAAADTVFACCPDGAESALPAFIFGIRSAALSRASTGCTRTMLIPTA